MRKYFCIIITFFTLITVSCSKSSSSSTLSSIARLSALAFVQDSKNPGLNNSVWTIEERLDTGLVYTKDSMLYGTRMDSVRPVLTFAATPGAAVFSFPDTIVRYTGYDTLDFSELPIYLTIQSADRTNTKVYEIRPTVHQVDPDLYTWTKLNSGIYPPNDSEQKVLEWNDQFVMIVSNGFELNVYRSPDGVTWTDLGAPKGLAAGTRVRQIISDEDTFYYAQGNTVYTSPDAINWTAHTVSQKVVTMLLYWEHLIWVLAQKNDYYELAWFTGDTICMTGIVPTGEFPVSDFGTVKFQSASGRNRAMIIGGFAENGKSLDTRWNLEYAKYMDTGDGVFRLEEFSIGRPKFQSLTGVSVVWYNQQLILFGGVNDQMTYLGRNIYVSTNEGMTWTAADTTKNRLPEIYQARQKQNAIVRDNYIYLFGGQTSEETYSDVYRGRLNSIDWK